MSKFYFKQGVVYRFLSTEALIKFCTTCDAADGDSHFADFVGPHNFEVTNEVEGMALSVKNSKGEILTHDDLDQSFLVGEDDSVYFIADTGSAEQVYIRAIEALRYVLGDEGIDHLARIDALQYINQTAHQLYPFKEEE